MSLELPYGIKRLDTSSNVDDLYGYYNSIQEALTNIVPGLRKGGRTVGIKQEDGSIVEYWWENDNDLSDAGLKLKSFNNSESFEDGFITLSNISLNDNDITIELGLEWRINGIVYELSSNWTDTIPFATEGYTRKDIIVATNTGALLRIEGDEDEENAVQPATPVGTLLLTVIDVYGDFLGNPQEPEIAFGRIKKAGEKWKTESVAAGGAKGIFLLESYGRNVGVYVYDAGGDFEYGSLRGVILDQSLQAYPVDELLWDGALIRIQHLPTTSNKKLRIRHNDSFPPPASGGKAAPFWFSNEEDYELVPYEILTFIYKKSFSIANGVDGAFIFLGSNMSSEGSTSADQVSYDNADSGLDATNVQEAIDELVGSILTNDDNTLIIDGNIIRLNVTNITEEFTANGTDRNFEMVNIYTSIENVFINGVRIKSSDYITISEQEIEIKKTVTLLSGDEVVIQGTMFIE